MLKITVEGIYESDTGSGQKQYVSYNYDFCISKNSDKGIMTHAQRRFIPYLIAKDKAKANKIFSRLRTCVITDVQNVDEKNSVIGKDINELNEYELQDLACLFDLYEIPLPYTCSITEMREKATIAYLKNVLKIPMSTPQERAQLDFLKHYPDGTYKLDLKGEKVLVKVPAGFFEKKAKEIEKKSLAFFENIVNVLSNNKDEKKDSRQAKEKNQEDEFPSADSLLTE